MTEKELLSKRQEEIKEKMREQEEKRREDEEKARAKEEAARRAAEEARRAAEEAKMEADRRKLREVLGKGIEADKRCKRCEDLGAECTYVGDKTFRSCIECRVHVVKCEGMVKQGETEAKQGGVQSFVAGRGSRGAQMKSLASDIDKAAGVLWEIGSEANEASRYATKESALLRVEVDKLGKELQDGFTSISSTMRERLAIMKGIYAPESAMAGMNNGGERSTMAGKDASAQTVSASDSNKREKWLLTKRLNRKRFLEWWKRTVERKREGGRKGRRKRRRERGRERDRDAR